MKKVSLEEFKRTYPTVNVTESYFMDWIKVNDRLPDKEGHYLVTTGGLPFVAFFKIYKNVKAWVVGGQSQIRTYNATHWLPLPESPPKESRE
jgi:hypothetical protein